MRNILARKSTGSWLRSAFAVLSLFTERMADDYLTCSDGALRELPPATNAPTGTLAVLGQAVFSCEGAGVAGVGGAQISADIGAGLGPGRWGWRGSARR